MGSTRYLSIFGDSISTFVGCNPPTYAVFYTEERAALAGLAGPGDTWWSLLAQRLGAQIVANDSYSGSMVEGAGYPAGESVERAKALLAGAAEPDAAAARPTDVIVFLGTNDYGWGSARAQAAGRSSATPPAALEEGICPPPAVPGLATREDLAGFEAAYARMLQNIRATCPDARIWCVSLLAGRLASAPGPAFCWNLRGIPMRDYNQAIRQATLQVEGCSYVGAADFGLDYEAIDGTHPTVRGMRQIASLVQAAMEGQGLEGAAIAWGYPASDGGPDAWRSRELCPNRPCVGCSHARDTGKTWMCVCERDLG